MIAPESALVFFSAAVALALVPGPDNIFVLTQSALHGKKRGLLVTLGLCTGLLVHTSAVALGVAAIFATSALAFNTLKILGALYLLYLARQAFRAGAVGLVGQDFNPTSPWKLYARGVIMNVTNPKVAVFFLAFLPQFADPTIGSVTLQILAFGGLFIIATVLVFGSVSWAGGVLAEQLNRSANAQRLMNRLAGFIFIALGLRLLASSQ